MAAQRDHILQLIFLDLEHLPDDISHFKDIFAYYRLIVMPTDIKDRISVVEKMKTVSKSELIICDHIFDDIISVYSVPTGRDALPQLIYLQNQTTHSDRSNSFDMIFGGNERKRLFAINNFIPSQCNQTAKIHEIRKLWKGLTFIANFFASHSNANFINIMTSSCKNKYANFTFEKVQPKSRKFFKELSTEYEPIGAEHL